MIFFLLILRNKREIKERVYGEKDMFTANRPLYRRIKLTDLINKTHTYISLNKIKEKKVAGNSDFFLLIFFVC